MEAAEGALLHHSVTQVLSRLRGLGMFPTGSAKTGATDSVTSAQSAIEAARRTQPAAGNERRGIP